MQCPILLLCTMPLIGENSQVTAVHALAVAAVSSKGLGSGAHDNVVYAKMIKSWWLITQPRIIRLCWNLARCCVMGLVINGHNDWRDIGLPQIALQLYFSYHLYISSLFSGCNIQYKFLSCIVWSQLNWFSPRLCREIMAAAYKQCPGYYIKTVLFLCDCWACFTADTISCVSLNTGTTPTSRQ